MTPRATARLTRLSILSCRQHDDHEVILDYSHHPPVKLIYIFSQDWGASCDVDDVSIKWHIPSLEEKTFAKELLETFLLPVLDRLTQFTQGNEMTRYVLRHLSGKKPVFHLPPPPLVMDALYLSHVGEGEGVLFIDFVYFCTVILPLILKFGLHLS